MSNRTEILNELKEISQVVANINLVNVFSVPEGYFESLPEIISAGLEHSSPLLDKISRQMPNDIPQGYFDTLADTILAQVREQTGVISFDSNRSMPNDIPQNYFENLAGNILSKAKHENNQSAKEEIEMLSFTLAGISRQMPNDLPVGYFEFFAENVQEKIGKKEAKVVSMFSQKTWLRYAVAAVFVGVITVSSMMIFKNKPIDVPIAKNNQEQIETPVQQDEDTKQFANVSDDELQKYADGDVKQEETSVAVLAATLSSDNLEDILKQLPDEALQPYAEALNSTNN